jgi:beta-xylosidase
MDILSQFDLTVTFCFTPEHLGIVPHHTSAPRELDGYAEFCAEMVSRYAIEEGKICLEPVTA